MQDEPESDARPGWGRPGVIVAVAAALVVLDAAMIAWVVPAAKVAGWAWPWAAGLIAIVDGMIVTLAWDIASLPGLPKGTRLVPLLMIWQRACWILMLLIASLILVSHPAAFDFR